MLITRVQLAWRSFTVIVAIASVLLASSSAQADWYSPLVRITCIPEAAYAAVETLGLYNIANAVTPAPEALASQGIYELRALVDKPASCKLPQGELQIKVINYHGPQAQGSCGGVEDADLSILLGGTQIAFAKSTHGGCNGSQRHDIRVSRYELQHCILHFAGPSQMVTPGDFTTVETACKSVPLR